jgi:hypothetical protein
MLDEQAQLDDADSVDFVVMRALLKRGRGEADSVDTFEPYTHIQEPNPGAREGMVQIIRQSLGGKRKPSSLSTTASRATHPRPSRPWWIG